jgi:hypothetical protein
MDSITQALIMASGGGKKAAAGLTWTQRSSGVGGNRLWSVAASPTLRVAIGDSIVTRSFDGITWTVAGDHTLERGRAIVWHNNLFVAAGFDSNFYGKIATSPDGITWTTRLANVAQFTDMQLAGDLLIASGPYGTLFTSPDGISWTSRYINTQETLRGATKGDSLYVIVGSNGKLMTSPDAITWTDKPTYTTRTLWEAIWTGSKFIAVGEYGAIVTSPTGEYWTSTQIGGGASSAGQLSVAYSGNELVSVGGGTLYQTIGFRTINQTSWASVTITNAYGYTLWTVIWDGAQFIAVGDQGLIFTSNS